MIGLRKFRLVSADARGEGTRDEALRADLHGTIFVACDCDYRNIFFRISALPGARFSEVPKTFRARKAICEPANRLFRKADLLRCFRGNKRQTDCEV